MEDLLIKELGALVLAKVKLTSVIQQQQKVIEDQSANISELDACIAHLDEQLAGYIRAEAHGDHNDDD